MFNFEKLEVWQKAIDFADLIYKQTQSFPLEERFGLTNHLRRAAVSISSNIAEGSSRSSKTDFARFTEIAAGSMFEAVSQAFIARGQSRFSEDQFQEIYADGKS
jgi:four helix bundle protein